MSHPVKNKSNLRSDLNIIQHWVSEESQVLDLGCGEGDLLAYLKHDKNCKAYGLEIHPDSIVSCVEKGLNVIEHDLNDGLRHFKDNAMDTVIMTQALQAVSRPDVLLDDMLRVGKEAIITFPNFGYWRTRFYLMIKGKMPMSKTLPFLIGMIRRTSICVPSAILKNYAVKKISPY